MLTVLLIEDNEMNADMLSRRLARQGYSIKLAVNGIEGVEMGRSCAPDLILMDMNLPLIDGWEATRLLKADPETAGIPIIGLSAHAMTGDSAKALAAGCDDYDTKPLEFTRLLQKIDAILGMKRSSE